jgi:hypothetical protein
MSWLRRIFGGSDGDSDGETRRAHGSDEGPVHRQHVVDDLGFVPSPTQWLAAIEPEPWMMRSRRLSRSLEEAPR